MRGHRAWVLLGAVVIGWLIVPRAVSAVSSIVEIQSGNSSTKANVTEGKQLQVVEAAPSTFREYAGADSGPECNELVTVPSDKGLIVRTVSISVLTASSSGFHLVELFPNGTCSGDSIVAVPTNRVDVFSFTLTPGFAVANGGKLSFNVASSGAVAGVFVWGYQVPDEDVPSTTSIT